jgi:hypothetical protein
MHQLAQDEPHLNTWVQSFVAESAGFSIKCMECLFQTAEMSRCATDPTSKSKAGYLQLSLLAWQSRERSVALRAAAALMALSASLSTKSVRPTAAEGTAQFRAAADGLAAAAEIGADAVRAGRALETGPAAGVARGAAAAATINEGLVWA